MPGIGALHRRAARVKMMKCGSPTSLMPKDYVSFPWSVFAAPHMSQFGPFRQMLCSDERSLLRQLQTSPWGARSGWKCEERASRLERRDAALDIYVYAVGALIRRRRVMRNSPVSIATIRRKYRMGSVSLRCVRAALTMPLPIGSNVAQESWRRFDPSQTADWPAGPAGLAPQEAATVIAGNIVARHCEPR